MLNDIPNRLNYTERKDGYIISTIKSIDGLYGEYETAIRIDGFYDWRVAKSYETEEEAIKGHDKYVTMSEEEINRINYIDLLDI